MNILILLQYYLIREVSGVITQLKHLLTANSNMDKQQTIKKSSSGDKNNLWNEVTNPVRKPKNNNTATLANATSTSNSGGGSSMNTIPGNVI